MQTAPGPGPGVYGICTGGMIGRGEGAGRIGKGDGFQL